MAQYLLERTSRSRSITKQGRIQDSEGGFRTFRRGGGVVQEFQERIQIVAGSWDINKQKLQTAVGGGGVSDQPKKTLYPRMTK